MLISCQVSNKRAYTLQAITNWKTPGIDGWLSWSRCVWSFSYRSIRSWFRSVNGWLYNRNEKHVIEYGKDKESKSQVRKKRRRIFWHFFSQLISAKIQILNCIWSRDNLYQSIRYFFKHPFVYILTQQWLLIKSHDNTNQATWPCFMKIERRLAF